MTDGLTPAELAADALNGYGVALHALSGAQPAHDDPTVSPSASPSTGAVGPA